MRNRFDPVAKQIGRAALGRSGITVVHDEISPEIQHADLRHEPDPRRKAERKRLGLLGRLAAVLCLIEIYGHAPSSEELRACLAKHIAFWQQQARRARAASRRGRRGGRSRRGRRPPKAFVEPFLWIIAAGSPTAILAKLKLEAAPGWPAGVYFFGDDVLRVGIVVASELPRDRSTLLVRLMAAGPLLSRAIEDLGTLPPDAYERAVAGDILLRLQHVLQNKPNRTPEEQELVVTMLKSWKETWTEIRRETRTEARREARTEMRADSVLTVLRARGIVVPIEARKRILAEKDLHRLAHWLKKASTATSIEQVIGPLPARPRTRARAVSAR